MTFKYGIDQLTLDSVNAIAAGTLQAELCQEAIDKINKSRQNVDKMAASDKAIYGINTGFGPLCDTQISPEETNLLQKNLLITHAVGVGEPIAKPISKLMLITKVHALSQGYSGIRLAVVERMLKFIELDIIPVVPEQGSVGASGDLAPLSHLFLPLLGEGEFWIDGDIKPAAEVLKEHGLEPMELHAKEGLALINGTQFILSHAITALTKMGYLLDLADIAGAMSIEGMQGSQSPFREELHAIRAFKGNVEVAARMRRFFEGSENMASHTNCDRVQDPYSLRCIPQVHGASRNAYNHLKELAETEMNSVTDNPIVISEEEAISGGGFHGQPLAMVLDYASIAAAELGNIADRRCYLLLEGLHGLPRLLTSSGGLNSGMMIPQYVTAALVTENKSLCFPPSADSVPTSMGQEDHVSMGSISGRKLNQILGNLDKIFAIELMYAAQAIEFRRPNKCSDIIEENVAIIRNKVAKLEEDRLLKPDIDAMVTLVKSQAFKVN
ncbi:MULTISPECIES: histidine ammonia-lyase [Pseudoalteromonas]|jgi:histidine ammonia-lyase|uniref:Histidine ammonia-lyase n=1 Tax=Pseudoalteromonas lipolytica TaxID=570156 RepID=A0AAD0S3M9_9GAMM|nr:MULTISPECIES: histidine ammonia-lyase [Pseudoalteromonas]AXV67108.1 histidine ammonia-lyase [Pseudoalteromonas donghaensis]MAE01971.1 histidine ammonia-lyase [Pseudoalteromonas sp.]MCC9660436.1 histidine ammonia-lyase [Pseudoalteromonas sp. MB41]QLJ10488.1 histidine ammonia-lyase [Pseudoalteromonas sp. JSTW]QMW16487.1 histidine ammonia-lyase [Pseudoalteromonas sp. MT33b]|tara:strand:+ start:10574 stop:12067 length:1494 start_codon:yes stop_codon:yes gene_type:complete